LAELAVLVGLQASGKTTFYRRHLAATHAHVSKDNWPNAGRRDRRQLAVVDALLADGCDVAVDNTNPSAAERAGLLAAARRRGARAVAYWFPPDRDGSVARNAARSPETRVPDVGMFATLGRLAAPTVAEGFDRVHRVRFDGDGGFVVEDVCD
jgi:predicted kinase